MGLMNRFLFLETERPLTAEERLVYAKVLVNRDKAASKLPSKLRNLFISKVCTNKNLRVYSALANRAILSNFYLERSISENYLRQMFKKGGFDSKLHEASLSSEEIEQILQDGLFTSSKVA